VPSFYLRTLFLTQSVLAFCLRYLNIAIRYLLAVGMAVIMFAVVFHVFGRYFVGKTYMGTMELVRYTMVWVTMLGAAYAFGSQEHVAIFFFRNFMSGKAWFCINFAGNALLCLFLVIMVIGGIEISIKNLNQTSLGLQVSMFFPYLAIPVGGFIMIPYILNNILEDFFEIFSIDRNMERTK
jgi:TRAP-type C4-dicarboxylate transport system permease small subunit